MCLIINVLYCTITILDSFLFSARITIQEGSIIRSIQVAVSDVLKTGLIGTVADKKGNYSESAVYISYEGLYFMLRYVLPITSLQVF